MTIFVKLLNQENKQSALIRAVDAFNNNQKDNEVQSFSISENELKKIPGSPFAYWISTQLRDVFRSFPAFEAMDRSVRQGLATADDFRFLRCWWENGKLHLPSGQNTWVPFAKGGTHSPYYADVYMTVNWRRDGYEIKNFKNSETGKTYSRPQNVPFYFKVGAFQTLRAGQLAPHLTPPGCIFGHNGFQAFCDPQNALAILGILNSSACDYIFKVLLGRFGYALYIPGTLQVTPFPEIDKDIGRKISSLTAKAWRLRRHLNSVEEVSHSFLLPQSIREHLGDFDTRTIEADLARIQTEIDDIAFDLYGFNESDRAAVQGNQDVANDGDAQRSADDESYDDDIAVPVDQTAGLLSWAVCVAFGRFDWRLATGERAASAEPEPFDPLPAKSPGMLPDGAEPFHTHAGILVDDQGHPHDLARLVEEVLNRVDVSVPDEVRRWLRKDFFAFHLQRYSKSRRKAPIYWPLATPSGSYTLWVYYPSLNNQTLFTAVNDFLDGPNGKLTQVSRECAELRIKGNGRSRDEEKQYETLQTFEQELTDLRDTLLKIAPSYQPNHDDGVQITAAPLWPLFRHKPWQKVMKDTWAKLEKGDYDWAHLAMAYWPERVREKCKTDKSLAIAHGFEDLYVEQAPKPKNSSKKKAI